MKAEKTKSKRMIFPILLAILMVISIGIVKIYAEISKECPDSNCYDYCNNCHIDANAGTTIKDCIGCHSSSESSTYYDLGGYLVPVVNYTGPDAPVNYLAGGNFWWVNEENSDADDSKGHNIFFKQNDNELSKAPGGLTCSSNSCHENFDREYAGSDHGLYGRQGCTGCHMVDDLFQPSGYHHADDGNQYDIINRFPWYRFLKSHLRQGGIGGVIGIEDPKWQSNNESDPEHHNEYLGKAGGFTFDSWSLANQSTITAFCSGCHGKFHIQHNDPNGHWIRHPSDAIIPNTGEYKVYTIYNTLAPVARQNLNSISPDVTPGEDLVSCISCHRPHGSPYPDMLRWDPNTCEGCFICHSDKSLVNGPCNKCHTMHHSQDGVDPFIYFDPERDVSTGPQNALLFGIAGHPNKNNSICIVCHSGSSSVINGCDTFTKAPQIDLTGDAMLAGGTFATTDAKKHNVLGLALPDASFGIPNIPPGGSNDDIGGADQITCAGTTGCHGNRAEPDNLAAVYGAHHANERDPLESGPLDGTTVGKSYRFLSKDGVDVVFNNSGVLGLEHSDWEYNRYDTKSTITSLNASEHNVYDAEGINKLCASCHGDFHGADNPGGPIEPWLRHPTDITLDAAAASGSNENTDYPGKNDDLNNYSTKAPVGYNAYFSNNQIGTAVAKSQGQVLCISCHRPHGSLNPDLLRWDPNKIENNGCIICHSKKSLLNGPCNKCHTIHEGCVCLECHSIKKYHHSLLKNLKLKAGWNMISLPIIPECPVVSGIFPEGVAIFGYDKGVGYKSIIKEEGLEIGKGYWILFSGDKNYTLTGESILKYTLPVYEDGWYMIGGCSSPARASINIGKIVAIYSYVSGVGYERVFESKNLEPGKGYWILFSDIDDQSQLMVKKYSGNMSGTKDE